MTPREYVKEVEKHSIYDPVLSFQLLEGFIIKRINTKYLPDDMASDSFATLMEWNNIDYLPKSRRVYQASFSVRICAIQYMMKKIEAFSDFARQIEYYVDIASDFDQIGPFGGWQLIQISTLNCLQNWLYVITSTLLADPIS